MPDQPDLIEQLAAFLAGDLDEPASAAVQARIDSEPWVATQADELADLAMGLGRVDDVEPPAGYSERLRARLADEAGITVATPDERALPHAGAAAVDGGAKRPAGRSDRSRPAGPRRGSSRFGNRLAPVLGAAAAVVLLAFGSVTVLQGGFSSSSDEAASDTSAVESRVASTEAGPQFADALSASDSADAAETALAEEAPPADSPAAPAPAEDDAMEDEPAEEATDAAAPAAADATTGGATAGDDDTGANPATAPRLLELGPIGTDEQTITEQIRRHPAAERWLGEPVATAEELRASFTDQVLAAAPFEDGTEPGGCLVSVLDAAEAQALPVIAASLSEDGDPLTGYALVTSAGGQSLDRVQVWVVNAADCGVVAVVG